MQGIAMEVADSVKPCFVVEIRDINDQCVAFPAATRVSHPSRRYAVGMLSAVHGNCSQGVRKFVSDGDVIRGLNNFEGIRHVRSEEHTSELQSLRHLVCRLV